MMDTAGLIIPTVGAGISTRSPVADVKRTARESPYAVAVASPLRRDVMGSRLTKFLQVILCLRLWFGHDDGLIDQSCRCARGIAATVERLLLTQAPPPVARGLAGPLPERGCEGGLRNNRARLRS